MCYILTSNTYLNSVIVVFWHTRYPEMIEWNIQWIVQIKRFFGLKILHGFHLTNSTDMSAMVKCNIFPIFLR